MSRVKKALMIIGGQAHPFEACAAIFKKAMEEGGQFAIEVTQERSGLADPSGYDAVVMYTVGGEMSRDQEQGLIGYVRNGGGLLAIHCANADMEKFPGYLEMVGTAFVGHGPVAEFEVETAAGCGDILPRLSEKFAVTDEFYFLERRTQAELREFQHGTWQFERRLLGYVHPFGQGRVLYTALGHDERTFGHADFQDLAYKGLRYVCGLNQERTIRIGLLGYGPAFKMGQHHAQRIAATQGFELAAVCDRDPARLEAAKEEQGAHIATFTEAEEMAISGLIDLGIVILPHAHHAWGIRTLLKAGVHAISEKPFALTAAECDEMIALAREKGLMLSVYHNRHWDPDVLTLRQVIESGRIGQVYSLECNMVGYGRPGQVWRSHKPISGGALYDMGAHQFEKILQLLPRTNARGERINRRASLYGHFLKKKWHGVTNEDYARAYARFDSGAEAQVVVSNLCSAPKPLWTVLGTQGSAVIEGWRSGAQVVMVDETGARYAAELAQLERPNGYYKNAADHLLAGAPLIISPEWAKATIQLIEGCELAARQNRVVEIEFDF
jgi:predicted dehydrogenase/type 1 glutamine amidotransferase